MTVEKTKGDRKDAIIGRMGQIEAALCDLRLAAENLRKVRKERTELWMEYREIVAAEINSGSEPAAVVGTNG